MKSPPGDGCDEAEVGEPGWGVGHLGDESSVPVDVPVAQRDCRIRRCRRWSRPARSRLSHHLPQAVAEPAAHLSRRPTPAPPSCRRSPLRPCVPSPEKLTTHPKSPLPASRRRSSPVAGIEQQRGLRLRDPRAADRPGLDRNPLNRLGIGHRHGLAGGEVVDREGRRWCTGRFPSGLNATPALPSFEPDASHRSAGCLEIPDECPRRGRPGGVSLCPGRATWWPPRAVRRRCR